MPLIHMVLFKFNSSLSKSDVDELYNMMLGLRESCLHPTNQKPYILSVTGGVNCSDEKFDGGLTHGFVIEFASKEDRDYYVTKDPVHAAFGKHLVDTNALADIRVLDYLPGVL